MKLLRKLSTYWHRLKNISNHRERLALTLVDVGASYFLHKPWIPLILGRSARLISVDPNGENLAYLDGFVGINAQKMPVALASGQGTRTLYVTNVDSGSSLFPPDPSSEDLLRSPGLENYLFPVKEKLIEVTTLDDVLEPLEGYCALKIDTQGAELEILRGASRLLSAGKVLAIELEVSLLSRPIMKGSPNFVEIASFLESQGFELLWVRPTTSVKTSFRDQERQVEADALFALKKDRVLQAEGSCLRAYSEVLKSYGFITEIRVLERMAEGNQK